MAKIKFSLLLMFFSLTVSATGVPEKIEVTVGNAARLGFELTLLESGDPLVRLVRLTFPSKIHGDWAAMRVQTYLLNNDGDEIALSSADYIVSGDSPSVMAYYMPENYDLAFVVQYFCKAGGGYRCAEAYHVSSTTKHLEARGID